MSTLANGLAIQLNLPTNDRYAAHDDLGLANDANSVPSLGGIPLKYISLVTLAVQNSALTIIMHYSRISTPASQAYSAATAVLLNELLKGLISFVIAVFRVEANHSETNRSLLSNTVFRLQTIARDIASPDCWKLSIPAILYVIQNNLQYVAVSNLDAATFQVSYQMKIMTTAGFSVLLLRKKLSSYQWLGLFCLAIGVGVVQLQAGAASGTHSTTLNLDMNPLKGFLAVVAACFTSGLAGVYFEMVLKNSQADLWVRNVQLSLFSILPALAPILFSQKISISQDFSGWFHSLFDNFGAWAWATVSVQVLGGLLTALVIKYSDNILKGFATSLSIVISFMASVALFDFHITVAFVLGSAIVLVATWLYNQQPKRGASKLPGKDFFSWASERAEKDKWRGTATLPRIPSGPPAYSGLSSSRSSSTLSLSSLGKSDAEEQQSFVYTR